MEYEDVNGEVIDEISDESEDIVLENDDENWSTDDEEENDEDCAFIDNDPKNDNPSTFYNTVNNKNENIYNQLRKKSTHIHMSDYRNTPFKKSQLSDDKSSRLKYLYNLVLRKGVYILCQLACL